MEYANTPIVRITGEQLEYLISRIVAKQPDIAEARRRTFKLTNITLNGSSPQQVLAVDETRVSFAVAVYTNPVSISPDPGIATNTGIVIPAGQHLSYIVSWEDFGYIVTRPWFAQGTGVNSFVSIIEISSPGFWNQANERMAK